MENDKEENQKFKRTLVHRISFQFVIGGINQLILGCIIYILGSIAKITRFDLFILFSLKNLIFWSTLAYIFLVLGGLSLFLSVLFWIFYKNPKIVKIAAFGAILQIPFVFFGPFIGILLLQNIRLLESIDHSILKSQPQSSDPKKIINESQKSSELIKEIVNEVGLLFVGVSIYRLGLIILGYLFTIALSLLEVSLSYPQLSMDSIFLYRKVLLGFSIFTGLQLGFGIVYPYFWNKQSMKYFAYILTVLQFILFPIGFFVGISLTKGLITIYSHD